MTARRGGRPPVRPRPLLALLALAAARAAADPPSPTVEWSVAAGAREVDDDGLQVIGVGPRSAFVRSAADGAVVELALGGAAGRRTLPRGRCRDTEPREAWAVGRRVLVHGAGSYSRDERYSDGRGPGCPEEVWAVDRATGRLAWSRQLPGYSADAAVLVDGDGCLVVTEAAILALGLGDGRIRWRARIGDEGPIVGDGPRIDRDAGLALTATRLFFVDDPDGQWRTFRLVGLDRATGRRAWRTPLPVRCAAGRTFSGAAATGEVVAVGWTCRTACNGGLTCPPEAAHVVGVRAADGRILWERAFPGVEVDHLAAGGDAVLLVEGGKTVVALEAATGAPRWRAAFPETTGEDGLVVAGDQVMAWSGRGGTGAQAAAPVLSGLDLRTGAVAWRWAPPPVSGDWAVPWLGPWPVGGRLLVSDHQRLQALRVPGAAAGARSPRR